MIKSMTGFGRCELTEQSRKITVEMKAVNHRYLDINLKMPRKLNFFEGAVRSLLKKYVQRGKVDVFLSYEDDSENRVNLRYNEALAAEYVAYIQKMADRFGLENDLRAAGLSRYPEVLSMEEQTVDEEELWSLLSRGLEKAADQFNDSRMAEGEHLKQDLLEKLGSMTRNVEQIEVRSPQILEEYRARLKAKVEELLADVQMDESRLAAEVTIFADKICTDEETVRLRSHILSAQKTLQSGGSVGRKLDFIAQEMNREANTILSKANDLTVSNIAIDLKTEVEKVREQIQNIE